MDSRLKKNLNAGDRENRGSRDTIREAPEDKMASSDERTQMWKTNGLKVHCPLFQIYRDGTFAGYRQLTVTTA